MTAYDDVLAARNFLIARREDYQAACDGFQWPRPDHFNFALDWFDRIAHERDREALRIVHETGEVTSRTYADLSRASDCIAGHLRALGLKRGDAVLLMLGNVAPLWEAMLAIMKLGAVIVPTTTLLSAAELESRIVRADVRMVITASDYVDRFGPGDWIGVAVGAPAPGWHDWADACSAAPGFIPDGPTRGTDPLLLYFTSGTTAQPKLVLHSHLSYPVGHLSTMYWIGLQPGDVHLNISSPGWAKHAWSCVFAPWLAEATVLVLDRERFDAAFTLDTIVAQGVTTFCAPPTVLRHLVLQDLSAWTPRIREAVAAGEPLNPEVIARFRAAWDITVRDGFGQTETSALIANSPGVPVVEGKVGRPLPGFRIALLDPDGAEADEGEIAILLTDQRPAGLMEGYRVDGLLQPVSGAAYRTGDTASRSADGRFTYVGRADDVFKASDYRISPFELESVLIEHPAVAEAAVVPSPDPVRLTVPKAFIALAPGYEPDRDVAASILDFANEKLGPFKRIRLIEFAELPKTVSGKIRRVELRRAEQDMRAAGGRGRHEWSEKDLAMLPSAS